MNKITGVARYGFLIEVTAKKIKQSLQKHFNHQNLNLTVDQWVVLDHVTKYNGISQNVLCDKIFKDAPTVTRIVDILCKKNLIERKGDNSDRRKFNLYMKAEGNEMVGLAQPMVLETQKNGWNDLSDSDYEELVRILTTVNRNFENHSFFVNGVDKH